MLSIAEKFHEFHKNNPDVYNLLVKYALECKQAGLKKYSINALFERIRWHTNIEIRSDTEFKLSNNHRSMYARLLDKDERFTGMFRMKQLRSAEPAWWLV